MVCKTTYTCQIITVIDTFTQTHTSAHQIYYQFTHTHIHTHTWKVENKPLKCPRKCTRHLQWVKESDDKSQWDRIKGRWWDRQRDL